MSTHSRFSNHNPYRTPSHPSIHLIFPSPGSLALLLLPSKRLTNGTSLPSNSHLTQPFTKSTPSHARQYLLNRLLTNHISLPLHPHRRIDGNLNRPRTTILINHRNPSLGHTRFTQNAHDRRCKSSCRGGGRNGDEVIAARYGEGSRDGDTDHGERRVIQVIGGEGGRDGGGGVGCCWRWTRRGIGWWWGCG